MSNNSTPLLIKILILFLAFPFTMFIYYSSKREYDIPLLKDKDPTLALSMLIVTIILWLIIFGYFFNKWFLQLLIRKNNAKKILANGIARESIIINCEQISTPSSNLPEYELGLLFNNLSNTEVKQKITLVDTKPQQKRFETGKTLDILIDRDLKNSPYIALASATANLNIKTFLLNAVSFIICVGAIVCYCIYSYQTESYGMGWRFFSFRHPLFLSAIIILGSLFFMQLFLAIIRLVMGANPNDDNQDIFLKFRGVKTTAQIISSKIEAYINRQPLFAYQIQFTDQKNQVQQSTVKKIVLLTDLHKIMPEQVEILYLPENPQKAAFADEY